MTTEPTPVNVVVAGGAGAGKTTFVTVRSDPGSWTATAVAPTDLDRGRVTIASGFVVDLVGTPDEARFGVIWNELVNDAIGAVVLVDAGRLDEARPAVEYMKRAGISFVVAINAFDGVLRRGPEDVKDALQVPADVQVLVTDARSQSAVKATLACLIQGAGRTANAAA